MTHARGPDLHHGGLPSRIKCMSIKRWTDMSRRRSRREPLVLASKEALQHGQEVSSGGGGGGRPGVRNSMCKGTEV